MMAPIATVGLAGSDGLNICLNLATVAAVEGVQPSFEYVTGRRIGDLSNHWRAPMINVKRQVNRHSADRQARIRLKARCAI
jgi:hypothetical protein